VGEVVSLVDGNSVRDTITRIHDNTSGSSGGIQGQDGLDLNVHSGDIESFKHDGGHLLSVGLGVQWGLSEKDGMLLWANTELIVESVMPDLLHFFPVVHNTVLNGVVEGKNTSPELGLITNVALLVT
jgi:hypothetical protein